MYLNSKDKNNKNKRIMSRLQPYRNRIPTHIIKLLDVSSRITLFLVGQNGPLSFIFKDRLQNKFKTTIGAQINCTCSHGKNDHCIHSLYVLLKIFKISVQNPIMWQSSYIDSELSDIVAGKHTVVPVRQRMNRPNFDFNPEASTSSILPSDFYLKRQVKFRLQNSNNKAQPMHLEQDSVCPICQEEMKKNMNLTYCKVSCGNNYHLQCLKVWVSHKKNQQSKISCPMCRQQFHSNILDELKNEEIQWKKKEVIKNSHRYKCSNCGLEQIQKRPHKCILCEKFQLCQACYMQNKHLKHPFIRCNQMGEWEPADQRRPGELKIKDFIEGKRKESKNKQILQKLRQAKKSPSCLVDYICSSYPYVSKYISQNIDPYKKLNIEPEKMQCQKCGSKRMIFLRRLTCGHFIDHDCLKQNIRKGIMYCQYDGDKILKGYEDLLKKQNQTQYEKQKVALQVNSDFTDINMQKLLSEDELQAQASSIQTSRRNQYEREQQFLHNQISPNFRINLNSNDNSRKIVNSLIKRQQANQIRQSGNLSRDRSNKKSRITQPLNQILSDNPNKQFIVRHAQIRAGQKQSGFQRVSRPRQWHQNQEQKKEKNYRIQMIKRLPNLSGGTKIEKYKNNVMLNSNQPLVRGRSNDSPFNFDGLFGSSRNKI